MFKVIRVQTCFATHVQNLSHYLQRFLWSKVWCRKLYLYLVDQWRQYIKVLLTLSKFLWSL
jgi:hypothetical protein